MYAPLPEGQKIIYGDLTWCLGHASRSRLLIQGNKHITLAVDGEFPSAQTNAPKAL